MEIRGARSAHVEMKRMIASVLLKIQKGTFDTPVERIVKKPTVRLSNTYDLELKKRETYLSIKLLVGSGIESSLEASSIRFYIQREITLLTK